MIEVTWQSVISFSAFCAAVIAIGTLVVKTVRWFDNQNKQDKGLAELRRKHDEEMAQFKLEESKHVSDIKAEQTILTYGILACLKGLKEQGCNGPVTEAINKIEKHLNQKAHE